MKTFDLTEKETKAAFILVKSCLDGMGGNRPADLEFDEYTWVDIKDLMEEGYTQQQAAGLFSSLHSKAFIEGEYSPKRCETYVSTAGWRWLETIWDKQVAA